MRDHRRTPASIWVFVLLPAALAAAAPAFAATIVSCANGFTFDRVDRGFYVQNYTGATLGTVTVQFLTNGTVGTYTVSMTAHVGAYNGPLIGSTQTANFTEAGAPAPDTFDITYDFGAAPVTPGSTIAFVMVLVSGPMGGLAFHNNGPCGLGDATCTSCPGVVETDGTSPPLDTFRRASLAVVITGAPANGGTDSVPALQPWALVAVALALALVAVVVLRRLSV